MEYILPSLWSLMGAGTKLLYGWDDACSFVLPWCMVSFYSELRLYWTNCACWRTEPSVMPRVSGSAPQGALGSLQVSLHLGQVCYSGFGCSWTQNFQLWAPLQTRQEEDRKKNSILRMQSFPESPGRARVGQGLKVPVLLLKIFFPQFQWREMGGLEHKGTRSFKGKSSMLCEKALFLHIWNLWRRRPFSKAWKPFELLTEWQIHLILKAGEPTSDQYPDPPPSLTWGQTSDFINS